MFIIASTLSEYGIFFKQHSVNDSSPDKYVLNEALKCFKKEEVANILLQSDLIRAYNTFI